MNPYSLAADLLVIFHSGYAAFIVVGLVLILLGGWRRWGWVRNFWFRLLHLLMIAVVVEESLLGVACPLTEWENRLRESAGEEVAQGTFIGRMIHNFLFVDVSHNTLAIVYCAFGLAVLASFFFLPPRRPKWREGGTQRGEVGATDAKAAEKRSL
jgi:hypothetical protein